MTVEQILAAATREHGRLATALQRADQEHIELEVSNGSELLTRIGVEELTTL